MLMVFDPSVLIYEDELPGTMTAEEYNRWREVSQQGWAFVGSNFLGILVGPRVLWVEEKP